MTGKRQRARKNAARMCGVERRKSYRCESTEYHRHTHSDLIIRFWSSVSSVNFRDTIIYFKLYNFMLFYDRRWEVCGRVSHEIGAYSAEWSASQDGGIASRRSRIEDTDDLRQFCTCSTMLYSEFVSGRLEERRENCFTIKQPRSIKMKLNESSSRPSTTTWLKMSRRKSNFHLIRENVSKRWLNKVIVLEDLGKYHLFLSCFICVVRHMKYEKN